MLPNPPAPKAFPPPNPRPGCSEDGEKIPSPKAAPKLPGARSLVGVPAVGCIGDQAELDPKPGRPPREPSPRGPALEVWLRSVESNVAEVRIAPRPSNPALAPWSPTNPPSPGNCCWPSSPVTSLGSLFSFSGL